MIYLNHNRRSVFHDLLAGPKQSVFPDETAVSKQEDQPFRPRRKEEDMKLIYAIVRNDNEDDVTSALSRAGFSITKLNTTGGFLRKGNVTLMIGTEDDKVDQAIELIRSECGESQKITIDMPFISGVNMVNYATMPMQVAVGGATIFVVNVERYEKF